MTSSKSESIIRIDYTPRKAFIPFHNRTQRWACNVVHRRAGKTVAAINDKIRAAVTATTFNPLFGYVAPFRSQAKSVAWGYLKHFAKPIIRRANEAELYVDLINDSRIMLFGADNADAARGLGFDGLTLDEFGDYKPSVWGSVFRPALADKQGWATFLGTPKGKNQFWEIHDTAQRSHGEWYSLLLKASESGILPPSEMNSLRAGMSEDQWLQEMECSFEAAIIGAFYGKEMRKAGEEGRIRDVPYDPALQTYTAWDLGYRDDTAIWWYQVIRGEIHFIDFYAVSGASISEIAHVVKTKPYHYGRHFLPHDAKAKTLAAAGKAVVEQLAEHLGMENLSIVPDLSLQDGIQAVRQMLPTTWFDATKCREGIEALRQYEREYDEDRKAFRMAPKHNWCFTGETEILTRNGTCQIMNLPPEGEVLTSYGWRRYTNPRITWKNAPLVEVAFADGYSVRCTPDHLFKTESGWKSAESLTPGSQIQSVSIPSRNILTAASTAFSRLKNISREAVSTFIAKFGAWLLAQSPMAVISTIEMQIEPTTSSTIWSAFPLRFTFAKRLPGSPNEHSARMRAKPPQHGTGQKRGVFGIAVMPNDQRDGTSGLANQENAHNAKIPSKPFFGNRDTLRSIARRFARSRHTVIAGRTEPHRLVIKHVRKLREIEDTWCLTVPSIGEFSLSNGAIVHNTSHPADAARMAAIAWKNEPQAYVVRPERPLIVGPGNKSTLEDMYATQRIRRRVRI